MGWDKKGENSEVQVRYAMGWDEVKTPSFVIRPVSDAIICCQSGVRHHHLLSD